MESIAFSDSTAQPASSLTVKMETMASETTAIDSKPTTGGDDSQKMLAAVLQFLKKNNLSNTASMLEKEASAISGSERGDSDQKSSFSTSDVSSLLSSYSNQADPSSYQDNYRLLKQFIESNLDSHKWELAQILYPVFIHMYLELLYNSHEEKAKAFFSQYSGELEDFHRDDLQKLSTVTKKEHMEGNDLMMVFHSSQFVIRMSRDSFQLLKRYLQEKNLPLLMSIVQDHVFIDVFDGLPRTKKQIHSAAGGMCGEAKRDDNKAKVFYGLLKEPDIEFSLEDEDEVSGANDDQSEGTPKPRKKKKREILSRKNKADPNAPPITRIPLPEMKDVDKLEKIAAVKESLKRVRLGGPDSIVPSACCYTFTNAFNGVTAVNISDDSSLLAAGFQDSLIRVWSLTPHSLRTIRPASELSLLDKEADDILERMMDDRTASESRSLLGHSGVVYAVSFSPCRQYLVSSSEDTTVRLWSLLTWTNLVVYKGHAWAVWGTCFGPHGHYFASCGQDRVARLWSTDHHQPLRIFAGHLSDVDCVAIHPNSNYLATGSSDRTIRVWDILSGNSVRVYTGHKASVMCLAWSPDGKYLASGGADNQVLVWDIPNKVLIAEFCQHTSTVCSLCFSRDGEVLASGGCDNTVKIWDFQKAISDIDTYDINISHGHITLSENTNYLLSSFAAKSTPLLHLHFTRRNLLCAVGVYTA